MMKVQATEGLVQLSVLCNRGCSVFECIKLKETPTAQSCRSLAVIDGQKQMMKIEQNIEICGLVIELTNSQAENTNVIQKHWVDFNKQLKKYGLNQNGGNWEKFGITFKTNEKYYYMVAISAESKIFPNHFISKTIPKGNYEVFSHKGKMENLKQTIFEIYKIILPKSNLSIEEQTKAGFFHFEKYDYRFRWNNPESTIDIYLPLKTTNDAQ